MIDDEACWWNWSGWLMIMTMIDDWWWLYWWCWWWKWLMLIMIDSDDDYADYGNEDDADQWSCWFWWLHFFLLRLFHWNTSRNVTNLFSLTISEETFKSISIHGHELWLITSDGRRAWRRMGISNENPMGLRWVVFWLGLPHPTIKISVGAAGIFALIEGGIVARFQGIGILPCFLHQSEEMRVL